MREICDTNPPEISLYLVSVLPRLRITCNLCHTVMADGHLPALDRSQGSCWLSKMSSVPDIHLNTFNLRIQDLSTALESLDLQKYLQSLAGAGGTILEWIARNIYIYTHI